MINYNMKQLVLFLFIQFKRPEIFKQFISQHYYYKQIFIRKL
jgi:hypothetical protein